MMTESAAVSAFTVIKPNDGEQSMRMKSYSSLIGSNRFLITCSRCSTFSISKDVENIKAVYNLVKVRGFKLAAARKMLRENKQGVDNNTRVMESLMKVRDDLKALKKQLDYLT